MFGIIPDGDLVLYAAYGLIGLAVFIVGKMLVQEQESRAIQDNLEDLNSRKASNVLVKLTRPLYTQYFVPMLRGKSFWDSSRSKYRKKIISAGLKNEITPDEFIAFKLSLIIFFPLVVGFMNSFELLDLSWYAVFGLGVAGWFYPDLWVYQRISSRRKEILNAMPFIVDLLALSIEAGLDFVGAISRVVEKGKPSPILDEFEQLLKEIRVGASRGDALKAMSERVNMQEIGSFISILISADQMGAPIGRVLRQQSETIRADRFLRAEKAGVVAAQKLMMVTIFLGLPAVGLLVLGPIVTNLISSGGF